MAKSNPYQVAQAALVLNHLVLGIEEINEDALTAFCNDPQSEERMKVAEIFAKKVEEITKKVSDLLKYLSTRSLPAIKEFVARDRFIVDTSETAELKISYLGDNFQTWLLGKVEKYVGGCEVKISKLLKRSRDDGILDELGDNAENALAHVYEFLKSANHKLWYIFYVKDADGVLRAVFALWRDDGWYISAGSVESPDDWDAGSQVVSR